jgi:hypothetical protein
MILTQYIDESDVARGIENGDLYLAKVFAHTDIDDIDFNAEINEAAEVDEIDGVIEKIRTFANRLEAAFKEL